MREELKEIMNLAEEQGQMMERQRIARAFYMYSNRERIPLAIQKDIIKIITVDIKFDA